MLIQQLREGLGGVVVEVGDADGINQYGAPPAYDDVINKPEDYPVYQSPGK